MSNSYRNGAFALGLVVGGGIILNLFLWLDYRARHNISSQSSTSQDTQYNEIGGYWDGLIGTFVSPSDTLAQWVMAFFTIAATGVLVLTLRSANKTNRAAIEASSAALMANDIMRNEQRPWLCFEQYGYAVSQDGEFRGVKHKFSYVFFLRWKNFGKIPADQVEMVADFRLVTAGEHVPVANVRELTDDEKANSLAILPPGISVRGPMYALSDNEMNLFVSRTHCLYLYGRVRYKGLSHKASFESAACVRIDFAGQSQERDGSANPIFDASTTGPFNYTK